MRLRRAKATASRGLIYALGMRFVGERTGQLLAEHFASLPKLSEASVEELEEVPEVAPRWRKASPIFFSESANRKLIQRLKDEGLKMTEKRAAPEEHTLRRQDVRLHRRPGAAFAR